MLHPVNSPGDNDLSRHSARRAHVQAVTANLAEFHTPLSPAASSRGFRGWHSRGYLPHFDVPDTVQAVTSR